MDLTHEEVEKYLCKIFTGSDLLYTKLGDEDIHIRFQQPDNNIRLRSNLVYNEAYNRAISEGMLSTEDLEKLIKERNLFTQEEEDQLSRLETKLKGQEILLAKTIVVKARQDRLKKIVSDIKSEMHVLRAKKISKLMMSADAKAEEERTLYLCWACTYNDDTGKLYWETYKDLLKENDLMFKDELLSGFLRFYRGLNTELIRYIARSNLWRIRYITSQKTAEQLFGVSTSDYTNNMLNLAYWSNYYQNIYEMLPEDRPPDLIIDDNDALDAYMQHYYDDRNRDDAARRSKVKTKGKLSAFDKEEVIVTQSNELYEDIKYDKPREAQRIKDKALIRKRTRHG